MTSFPEVARAWPREDAEAFLSAWRARAEQRRAWFAGVVAEATGEEPAADAVGLAAAWRYLIDRGFPGATPPGPEPGWPEWYVADDPLVVELTESDCWLVDGLVFFMGDVLIRRHPGVEWGMSTVDKLIVYQQPALMGFWTGTFPKPLDLRNQALRAVHRIRRDEDAASWPDDLLGRWAEMARLPEQPEEPGVDLGDVEVTPSQHAGWDLEIWIPEGAELELGRERFRTLRDRFAAIESFAEVAWEDREVFLVRLASPISPEVATAEVAAVMRDLATGA